MRTTRALPALAFALSVALPSSAFADVRYGAELHGGYNTFAMSDWNDFIDDANSQLALNLDHVDHGPSFGGGPIVLVNDQWRFGLHYERLTSKAEDQSRELFQTANVFGASALYQFRSSSRLGFGLGIALDYYSLDGAIHAAAESPTDGNGMGLQVFGSARHGFTPVFSCEAQVGYRLADVEIDDIGGFDVSSALRTEDYTGIGIRLGVVAYVPTAPPASPAPAKRPAKNR